MTELQKNNRAKEVLSIVRSTLESWGWEYRAGQRENVLITQGGLEKDGWTSDICISVHPGLQALLVWVVSPFADILKNKPAEASLAVCAMNANVTNGKFDYDLEKGTYCFSIYHQYCDCLPGPDQLDSMITTALNEVSSRMEDFRNISNGRLPIQEFMRRERR